MPELGRLGIEEPIGGKYPLEEVAPEAGDSLLERLGRADHQIETALPMAQIPKEPLGTDAQPIEYGPDIIQELAALVRMDGPTASISKPQVIVIGKA